MLLELRQSPRNEIIQIYHKHKSEFYKIKEGKNTINNIQIEMKIIYANLRLCMIFTSNASYGYLQENKGNYLDLYTKEKLSVFEVFLIGQVCH